MSTPSFSGAANPPRKAHSRTTSFSSDRPSTTGHSLMSPPQSVSPEAAFVAASAASQIVTNDHDSHSESWYDQLGVEPSGDTALVTPGALHLANNFIDQLLFNIIACARSTTLSSLRPAVSEVLKPKLAKDAINQADEELREYLGGGEVEDLVSSPSTASHNRDWDLELVWKRTRLRCMVYSSLGDMEEEDEDYYMDQEHLAGDNDESSEVVSPAVAIFLTSILEYVGEQVLVASGQAAFNRLRVKFEKEKKERVRSPGTVMERLVVEELDMERVALDRTLGRLWRSWKKRIRAPAEPSWSRLRGAPHSRRGSSADISGSAKDSISSAGEATASGVEKTAKEVKREMQPSEIPLPVTNNDIAEIEVPGLVSYSDEEDSGDESEEDLVARAPRPKSMMVFSLGPRNRSSWRNSALSTPPAKQTRKRANSLPTPVTPTFKSSRTAQAGPVVDNVETDGAQKDSGSPPRPSSADSKAQNGTDTMSSKILTNPISKIAAGAAAVGTAVGTAAVAGVTAMAQGSSVQTDASPLPTPLEEEEDEEIEEAEIMTSSRVSMGGRSSPSTSDAGGGGGNGGGGGGKRPPSIIPIVRSSSVRSARIIDVAPRSPVVRSQSFDVPDYVSARSNVSMSREGSVATPPIIEEGNETGPATGLRKHAYTAPSRSPSRRSASRDASPASSQSSLAGNVRHNYKSSPRSTPAPGATKVTILSTSTSSGTHLNVETRTEVPPKSGSHRKQPTLPALPERSVNRQSSKPSASAGPPSASRSQSVSRASPEATQYGHYTLTESPSSATSTSSKFKAVRNSEDDSPHRSQDVARNFEELLQNDRTLQYTLTPEKMREMNMSSAAAKSGQSSSPAVGQGPQGKQDANIDRSRSAPLARSASVSRATGLNSHPPTDFVGHRLAGPVPRAPPVSSPRSRKGAAQARDARVPQESLNDFAEFIRSTGPTANRPPAGAAHSRNVSVPVPMKSPMDSRPSTAASRSRFQGRETAASPADESMDFLDFLRSGPPPNNGNPPGSRNRALSRSTKDSDRVQMPKAVPDARTSQASTQMTDNSVQSSINSQSALLNRASKPAQYTNDFDDEDMFPKRKQRRVRDPYAIDLSDEDDDDDYEMEITPKSKPKQEESLADFLMNYDPPNPTPPQPFVTSQPKAQPRAVPKRKPSGSNLIARLKSAGGGGSSGSTPARGGIDPEPKGLTSEARNGTNTSNPKGSTRQASNAKHHTPITVNIPPGADNYNPPKTPARSNTSSGRVPMKKFEPREAVSTGSSRTSDLAAFLRDSEPPPSAVPAPMASVASPPAEKSSGFSRMFERRRKGSTAA